MGRIIGPYTKAKATHLLYAYWRPNAVAKDYNIRCHTSTVYTWEQRLQMYRQVSLPHARCAIAFFSRVIVALAAFFSALSLALASLLSLSRSKTASTSLSA